MAGGQLTQPLGADGVARELRPQVGRPLTGMAHVGQHQRQHLLGQPQRRDHQPLLVELGGRGRQAARPHAADVGVVGADGASQRRAVVDGRDERDVRQVGAAGERVVDDARRPRAAVRCQHRRHRVGHRAEVDGDVLGLGEHAPGAGRTAPVEQSRRSLMFAEWATRISAAPSPRRRRAGPRPGPAARPDRHRGSARPMTRPPPPPRRPAGGHPAGGSRARPAGPATAAVAPGRPASIRPRRGPRPRGRRARSRPSGRGGRSALVLARWNALGTGSEGPALVTASSKPPGPESRGVAVAPRRVVERAGRPRHRVRPGSARAARAAAARSSARDRAPLPSTAPSADSTPPAAGHEHRRMPSSSASPHACIGPAPPKATSASPRGSRRARPRRAGGPGPSRRRRRATTPPARASSRGQRGPRARARRRAARGPRGLPTAGARTVRPGRWASSRSAAPPRP